MTRPIRILHLDDSAYDVELIRETLASEHLDCEIVQVKGQKDFENAICHSSFDLILSDYSVPNYNGFAALDFARSKSSAIPFILVSGTLGEEEAVESLKNGATDYIVKQRLIRLGPAIRRAMDDAKAVLERKRTEDELRKSEERFQLVARATNDVIWDWDIGANTVWWSDAFQRVFGDRREELEPGIESWRNRLHPDDEKRVLTEIEEAISAGDQIWSSEYRFRGNNGEYSHILDLGHWIHDVSGKSVRMISAMLDMTERKKTEESLRQRGKELLQAQQMAQLGNWEWDTATDEFRFSDELNRIFGLPADQPCPTFDSFLNLIHPSDRPTARKAGEAAMRWKTPVNFECRIVRPDDSIRVIHVRGEFVTNAETSPVRITGTAQDITGRKRTEERIREQAALLDKAQDAICLNDMSQEILYWNKSAERLYGWTAEEAIGKNANDLLFQGQLAGPMEAIRNLIRRGEWKGELRQVAKGGQELVIESRWTLMRDERGEPKSILIINTDVTEKKQAEVQLFRTQRMESVGALAGGIAHDLNNSLSPILMAAEMLRSELTSDAGRHMLDTMKKSAERGADMVRQILSFSRGVGGEHKILQIRHLISDIEKFARSTFPLSIQVQTQLAESLFPISGDATQLHQVLLNLCINARDAMPGGGTLRIVARNAKPNETYAGRTVAGRHIVIEASDTGQGIPPELQAKIFEPFFTTKEIGKGTGLGLSTVVGIVKTHGGFIEVNSVVGEGTTFRVFLPATTGDAELKERKLPTTPGGSGELLLLVDDEVAILEMTKLILESFNYRILTANNALEAIELFKKQPEEIKVVVTDMMMPIMNGPELVQRIREINPNIKVIGTSGLGSGAELAQAAKPIVQTFLTKPYRPEALLLKLNQLLAMK